MARESFADEEVASVLSQWFVPVKVHREEPQLRAANVWPTAEKKLVERS